MNLNYSKLQGLDLPQYIEETTIRSYQIDDLQYFHLINYSDVENLLPIVFQFPKLVNNSTN